MLASDHVVLVLQAGCGVIYRGQGHRFGVDASVCRLMGSDFRVYAISFPDLLATCGRGACMNQNRITKYQGQQPTC
jgi:hypothetical protein